MPRLLRKESSNSSIDILKELILQNLRLFLFNLYLFIIVFFIKYLVCNQVFKQYTV